MSESYVPRKKNGLFDPTKEISGQGDFIINWQVMQDFYDCLKCFHLQHNFRHGLVKPPSGMPVGFYVHFDKLLRQHFELLREDMTVERLVALMPELEHFLPELLENTVDSAYNDRMSKLLHDRKLQPLAKQIFDVWKNTATIAADTHAKVEASVDDLWRDRESGLIHVVNYSVMPAAGESVSQLSKWHKMNIKKLRFEHYVLKQAGLDNLADVAIQVNAKAKTSVALWGESPMNSRFSLEVNDVPCDDQQVATAIFRIRKVLNSVRIPGASAGCHLCTYAKERGEDAKDSKMSRQMRAFNCALESFAKQMQSKAGTVAGQMGQRFEDAKTSIGNKFQKKR